MVKPLVFKESISGTQEVKPVFDSNSKAQTSQIYNLYLDKFGLSEFPKSDIIHEISVLLPLNQSKFQSYAGKVLLESANVSNDLARILHQSKFVR